jgi:hypothetical protein
MHLPQRFFKRFLLPKAFHLVYKVPLLDCARSTSLISLGPCNGFIDSSVASASIILSPTFLVGARPTELPPCASPNPPPLSRPSQSCSLCQASWAFLRCCIALWNAKGSMWASRIFFLRGCLGLLCSRFSSSAPAPRCQTHLAPRTPLQKNVELEANSTFFLEYLKGYSTNSTFFME